MAETPSKFKIPTLPNFDGYGDPVSHVNKFKIQMDIQKMSEDARCRIFPATLSDAAQEWFFKFPPASIVSWEMFVKEFYGQFYAGRVHPTEANQLVEIRQQDEESLKDYIQRFMRAATGANTVGDEGKMMAITAGVRRCTPLWKSLHYEPRFTNYEPRFTNYTALVESRGEVYQAMSSSVPYKKPAPIRKDISKRDTTKFCRYHNDYGHDTNECNQLKDEIEFLIRQGHLRRYVRASGNSQLEAPGGNE